MIIIFEPLSAGLMMMFVLFASCVRALRSAPVRLSGTSGGGRCVRRACRSVCMSVCVLVCSCEVRGSQLEGCIKSLGWRGVLGSK